MPSVLCDNQPTRAYFTKGVLFTDKTAADMADRLLQNKRTQARLRLEVTELKGELLAREAQALQNLRAKIRN